MKKKSLSIITLILGLIVIVAISLTVRESFSVRVLSTIAISIFSYLSFQLIDHEVKASLSSKIVIIIGTLSLFFIAFTNAPLRVTFNLLEPRFETLSKKLLKGEPTHFPTRIGPFMILDGGVRGGTSVTYFMTSGHAYEINGFVKDPKGAYFNSFSITPMNNRWAYLEED